MRRLRGRLTYANVVATLALFVALGGTATAASVLITSNAQVGKGTISGHHPPRGKHPNLIAGSVTGGDVANNSLTGNKINASSLGTVPNADKLDGKDFGDFGKNQVVFADHGPLPIQKTFTSHGGDLLVIASGSGFRASAHARLTGKIGMDVEVTNPGGGGSDSGGAEAFTNELDSHKAFVTLPEVIASGIVPAGTHTLTLNPLNQPACNTATETRTTFCTTTDASDVYNVTVVEIPRSG